MKLITADPHAEWRARYAHRKRLIVTDDDTCSKALQKLDRALSAGTPGFGLDCETDTVNRVEVQPITIQVSYDNQDILFGPDHVRALKPWVDQRPTMFGFESKFELWTLENAGMRWRGDVHDGQIIDYLVNENVKDYDLKTRMSLITGQSKRPDWKTLYKNKKASEIWANEQERPLFIDYSLADSADHLWLHENRTEELRKWPHRKDSGNMYDNFYLKSEVPLTKVLYRMERVGALIDTEYLTELHEIAQTTIEKIQRKFYREIDYENLPKKTKKAIKGDFAGFSEKLMNSPPQLMELFYNVLKYPHQYHMVKDKKTGQKVKKLTTDETALAQLASEGYTAAQTLEDNREVAKLDSTYLVGLLSHADFNHYVHTNFMQAFTATGRLSSRDPNLQNIPRIPEGDQSDVPEYMQQIRYGIRGAFIAPPGFVIVGGDYCLAPDTKVLTADLRWISISDVHEGQRLVAVDEHRKGRNPRLGRTAVVERTRDVRRPCYEITTSDGKVIVASDKHPWLARNIRKNNQLTWEWKNTEDLHVGDEFSKFSDTWEPDKTWEAGWLAGFFDGEGSLSCSTANLTLTQRDGTALGFAFKELKKRGFDFHVPYERCGGFSGSANDVNQTWMCGIGNCLRFLGTIRPKRLLENVEKLWEGKHHQRKGMKIERRYQPVRVTKIRFVGERNVVSIQTSTRTFIAEGFVTHNSQIETRLMAHVSGDENMIRACIESDIYSAMAAILFHKDKAFFAKVAGKWVHPEAGRIRQIVKAIVLGIGFGKQAKAIARDLSITEKEAVKFLKQYFLRFPVFYAWMRKTIREGRRTGHVRTITGRYRRLPDLRLPNTKDNWWRVSTAERQAMNSPIQGSAWDILKQTMLNLPKSGVLKEHGVKMFLTVHDELLTYCPKEEADAFAPKLKEIMMHPFEKDFRVPLEVALFKRNVGGKEHYGVLNWAEGK